MSRESNTTASAAQEAFVRYQRTGDPVALTAVFDLTAQELLLVAGHFCGGADAEDVLQATFVEVIRCAERYDPRKPLMPWLIGILTNQVRGVWRGRRRSPDPQQLQLPDVAGPDAEAEANELASAVVRALDELPDNHRHVLNLRLMHGLSVAEIAHSMGRPPATVKTWLQRGMARLRALLPASFAAGLAVVLAPGRGVAAVRLAVTRHAERARAAQVAAARVPVLPRGVLARLALVLVGASAIGAASIFTTSNSPPGLPTGVAGESGRVTDRTGPRPPSASRPDLSRVPAPARDLDQRGAVMVRVRWARDGQPAAGMWVRLLPRDAPNPRLRQLWLHTDARGRAVATGIAAGTWTATLDRAGSSVFAVRAGRRNDLELEVPAGRAVVGEVVDAAGAGVASARIWLSVGDRFDEGHIVAVADERGRFELRDVSPRRALCASAPAYRRGGMVAIEAAGGPLRLVLPSGGGPFRGRVVDAAGAPIAAASIMLGGMFEHPEQLREYTGVLERPPLLLRSGADGRFAAPCHIDPGSTTVWVRAPGYQVRRVLLPPAPRRPEVFEVVLEKGVTLRGRVLGIDGRPRPGVRIEVRHFALANRGHVYQGPTWVESFGTTDAGGGFEILGLPRSEMAVYADDGAGGRANATFEPAHPGATLRWDVRLRPAGVIRGRVLGSDGRELANWTVTARYLAGTRAPPAVRTDRHGRFAIADCDQLGYALWLRQPGARDFAVVIPGVLPSAAERTLSVPLARIATATVSGTLRPVPGGDLEGCVAHAVGLDGSDFEGELAAEGRFEIGPLPPGSYHFEVRRRGLPVLIRTGIGVPPHGRVDLGNVLLRPPGYLELTAHGTDGEPLSQWFSIVTGDCARSFSMARLANGRGRSVALPPGRHWVVTTSPEHGAVAAPFEIRPGAITSLEVEAAGGLPCWLRIAAPNFGGTYDGGFRILDASGELVLHSSLARALAPGEAIEFRTRLPAGRYVAEAWRVHGGTARADLVVDDGSNEVVLDVRR